MGSSCRRRWCPTGPSTPRGWRGTSSSCCSSRRCCCRILHHLHHEQQLLQQEEQQQQQQRPPKRHAHHDHGAAHALLPLHHRKMVPSKVSVSEYVHISVVCGGVQSQLFK